MIPRVGSGKELGKDRQSPEVSGEGGPPGCGRGLESQKGRRRRRYGMRWKGREGGICSVFSKQIQAQLSPRDRSVFGWAKAYSQGWGRA